MTGRTYRYFEGEVLYPFGHGLSYSEFTYDNLILEKDEIGADESLTVSVDVSNVGNLYGEEVVQLYVRDIQANVPRPLLELKGFERIHVNPDQTIVATMELGPDELAYYDESAGEYRVDPGVYEILVGPSSDRDLMLADTLLVR